jgi:hypothetical protein
MKCQHNNLTVGLITIVTFIALVLHMISHLIPILVTNEATCRLIEPWLHNPFVVVAAWSFLPLMIYHFWKDRKMHKEIHTLLNQVYFFQEELKRLKDKQET